MQASERILLADWVKVTFATPPDQSHFFGYYDKSPLSTDGRYLLAHRVSFEGRPVERSDVAEIGYFDLQTGHWHMLAVTSAFNWQQGAMLQWLGPDFQSRVIYNAQEGDHFVARVTDFASGNLRTIPHAVYAVHPSGQSALGVRFERHYFCRAYHYEGVRDERWNVPVHPEDGILAIDLETGAVRLLLRTAEIANLDPTPAMTGVPHWLEHLMWNRAGTRFGFLHRYGSHDSYVTRVFTSDADGTHLFCLPWHAEYSYTHMGWRDETTFVNFAGKLKPLTKAYASMVGSTNPLKAITVRAWRALKRIIPRDFVDPWRADSGYALVRDREGVQKWLSMGLLRSDGHPSWTHDGRFMVADTYADEVGYRQLLLYDAAADRVHSAGRFFSPFNACSYRCDLHPRFSRDECHIIIDTAHTGRRQMLVLDVNCRNLAGSGEVCRGANKAPLIQTEPNSHRRN